MDTKLQITGVDDFRFIAETHTYLLNGMPIPHITKALRPLYDFSAIKPSVLETKRNIGTAVHKMIELDLQDNLDEESIAPSLEGYYKAWRSFRRQSRVSDPRNIEAPLYSKKYRYAGTPDFVGTIKGSRHVIEVKTAQKHPATRIQTAAQLQLVNENCEFLGRARKRVALYLWPNGIYVLEPYTDRNDFKTFLSMLQALKFKEKYYV